MYSKVNNAKKEERRRKNQPSPETASFKQVLYLITKCGSVKKYRSLNILRHGMYWIDGSQHQLYF